MNRLIKKKSVQSVLWILLILAIWELSARLQLVNPNLLPPVTEVFVRLIHELFLGKLGLQAINSLWIILIGFFISIALGIIITALCVQSSVIDNLFSTISTIMNPLPGIALMPLIIMWFGIDYAAIIAVIIHGVLWSLVRHLLDGIRGIPPTQIEFGHNIGLSKWKLFTGIVVFAIMPEFVASIRIGWGRAWRAIISAEMTFGMIGSVGGIGYYVYMGRAYARITDVMAGIVVIALLGILIEEFVFKRIDKLTTVKWGMAHE